jgi:hypothetical protein
MVKLKINWNLGEQHLIWFFWGNSYSKDFTNHEVDILYVIRIKTVPFSKYVLLIVTIIYNSRTQFYDILYCIFCALWVNNEI